MLLSAQSAPDKAGPDEAGPDEAGPDEVDRERRRRLAEVFGDVLPEQTSDDLDPGDSSSQDDWYRAQVPPHHGG